MVSLDYDRYLLSIDVTYFYLSSLGTGEMITVKCIECNCPCLLGLFVVLVSFLPVVLLDDSSLKTSLW